MARRKLWMAATLGALSTLLVVAPAPAAQVSPDRSATSAVTNLTIAGATSVPVNFAKVMGYTPVTATLSDGEVRTINPDGSCSVPGEGKPWDFDVACKAHDFGYDLLRYADRIGEPLSSTARDAIDARLVADLREQCASTTSGTQRSACYATAGVFEAGVDFNSWRQMSGPPVDSSGMPRTVGLGMLVLISGALGAWALRRRAGRRGLWGMRPAPAAG